MSKAKRELSGHPRGISAMSHSIIVYGRCGPRGWPEAATAYFL